MTEPLELNYRMTPDLQLQAAYGWMIRKPEAGPSSVSMFNILLWVGLFFIFLAGLQNWLSPAFTGGLLIGIGGVMVLSALQCIRTNTRIKRLYGDSLHGSAETTFRLGEDALSIWDEGSTTRLQRAAIDEIVALKDATGVRLGAGTIAVPDSALPAHLDPKAFRQMLRDWKAAEAAE